MDQQVILGVVSAVVLLVVAILKEYGPFNRARSNLLKDIELYNELPVSSNSKGALLVDIDKRVRRTIITDESLRRDPLGIVLGILFIPLGCYLSWKAYGAGGWWYVVLPFSLSLALVGLVGFFEDIVKRKRDEKGRPLK